MTIIQQDPAHLAASTAVHDAGVLLCSFLRSELDADELGFKARIFVMDCWLKKHKTMCPPGTCVDPGAIHAAQEHCFWNGCKFVVAAIMHLVAESSPKARLAAIKPTAQSLGGLKLPSRTELREKLQRVDSLTLAAEAALLSLEHDTPGSAIAISFSVSDVELIKNPSTPRKQPRGNTFAHMAVLVVSRSGFSLLQGFGHTGYTLSQWLQRTATDYPLSPERAREDILYPLENILCESSHTGLYSATTNENYKKVFGVDLIALGNMRLGSQLDAFVSVGEPIRFTAADIRANIELLPTYDGPVLPCEDSKIAAGELSMGTIIPVDGGVSQSYVPKFARRVRSSGNTTAIPSLPFALSAPETTSDAQHEDESFVAGDAVVFRGLVSCAVLNGTAGRVEGVVGADGRIDVSTENFGVKRVRPSNLTKRAAKPTS